MTDTAFPIVKNRGVGLLAAPIASGDATIQVQAAHSLSAVPPYLITVGDEIMLVTGYTAPAPPGEPDAILNVTRGQELTTAAAWTQTYTAPSGATVTRPVEMRVTAGMLTGIHTAINGLETDPDFDTVDVDTILRVGTDTNTLGVVIDGIGQITTRKGTGVFLRHYRNAFTTGELPLFQIVSSSGELRWANPADGFSDSLVSLFSQTITGITDRRALKVGIGSGTVGGLLRTGALEVENDGTLPASPKTPLSGYIGFEAQAVEPGNALPGRLRLFARDYGSGLKFYTKDNAGTVIELGSGGATGMPFAGVTIVSDTDPAGGIAFGTDTYLYRLSAGVLRADDGTTTPGVELDAIGQVRTYKSSGACFINYKVAGDAFPSVQVTVVGRILFGPGGAFDLDVSLFRELAEGKMGLTAADKTSGYTELRASAFRIRSGVTGTGVDGEGFFEFMEQGVEPANPLTQKLRVWAADDFGVTQLYMKEIGGAVSPLGGGVYTEYRERPADPVAPTQDRIRMYAKDDGRGLTQIYTRDSDGAVKPLKLDPPAVIQPLRRLPGAIIDVEAVAQRRFWQLLPPESKGRICTGIGFMLTRLSASNDSCAVALYHVEPDGTVTRIATSGSLTQRLNLGLAWTPPTYPSTADYDMAISVVSPVRASLALTSPIEIPWDGEVYAVLMFGSSQHATDPARLAGVETRHAAALAAGTQMPSLGVSDLLVDDGATPPPGAVTTPPKYDANKPSPLLAVSFQKRIVCYGDSITEGTPTITDPNVVYPARLQAMLGQHALILNSGISASRTGAHTAVQPKGMTSSTRMARGITEQNGEIVLILAGSVDLANDARAAIVKSTTITAYSGASGGASFTTNTNGTITLSSVTSMENPGTAIIYIGGVPEVFTYTNIVGSQLQGVNCPYGPVSVAVGNPVEQGVIANLAAIAAKVVGDGGEPVFLTVLPFGTIGTMTAALETQREAVNDWIRGTGAAYAQGDSTYSYVDCDTAMGTFDAPNGWWELQPAYDRDGQHPTEAGFLKLAQTVFTQYFGDTKVPPQ